MPLLAYSMRQGNYLNRTVISGITWDEHLTELRVAISNPTDDSYQHIDVIIHPDAWVHQATVITECSSCKLSRVGGKKTISVAHNSRTGKPSMTATPVGDDLEVHDSIGNVYTTVASDSGYRVVCETLPSHSTVSVRFALVNVPTTSLARPSSPSPDAWSIVAAEAPPGTSDFYVFGSRPCPSVVTINGTYMRNIKPHYVVNKKIPVVDG